MQLKIFFHMIETVSFCCLETHFNYSLQPFHEVLHFFLQLFNCDCHAQWKWSFLTKNSQSLSTEVPWSALSVQLSLCLDEVLQTKCVSACKVSQTIVLQVHVNNVTFNCTVIHPQWFVENDRNNRMEAATAVKMILRLVHKANRIMRK